MKLTKGSIKRCGLFLYFDKDGLVDDYVLYMLQDLKKSIDHLMVVVNGYISSESILRLQSCSDEIISRANIGFDIGGYREGLFYLGWKNLSQYDELVLFNYTFFGPIYPFQEMFDAMSEKDLDFWGITEHRRANDDPWGSLPYDFLPAHLQSHFLVIRNSLLTSYQFKDFIYNTRDPRSYQESICTYEVILTQYFADLGFKWEAYINTPEYEGYSYNPHMFYIRDYIENRRCPIIKRRSFFTDYEDFLENDCGEASVEMYEWMRQNRPEYLNMIWDNLLRLEDMEAIHRVLGLDYILESFDTAYENDDKVALLLVLESGKKLSWYKRYLKKLPAYLSVCIYGNQSDVDIVKSYLSCPIDEISITDRVQYADAINWFAKIAECKAYKYVGVGYICDLEREEPYSNLASRSYGDFECLFYNENVVGNALLAFEENPRMDLLLPPAPHYGPYLEKEYGLSADNGNFWMRGNAFVKATENKVDDTWCQQLIQIAKNNYGYTGVAYSDRYAAIVDTNEEYILRENNRMVFPKFGADYHRNVVRILKEYAYNMNKRDKEEANSEG